MGVQKLVDGEGIVGGIWEDLMCNCYDFILTGGFDGMSKPKSSVTGRLSAAWEVEDHWLKDPIPNWEDEVESLKGRSLPRLRGVWPEAL